MNKPFLLADYLSMDNQTEKLALASPFAYRIWQTKNDACRHFLVSYPLTTFLSCQHITTLVQQYTANTSHEQDLMKGLRQLRQLLMMRWIWQDALQLISLEQLTSELSSFADSCIILAQEFTYQQLAIRYGIPSYKDKKYHVHPCDMAVFAMGKLGANELNLSSDIDLVFVYQSKGQTDVSHHDDATSIDNQKFMLKLGHGIIKILDSKTADGFVFRVDMRLRPWGEGSQLMITQDMLHNYFCKHGRDWERFAWLKARIVNSVDDQFNHSLQNIVDPFVFRHYVDYSAFSALRDMKSLIENQVAQRQDLTNVKLGAGGIRDIEFIVQAYQLIYGGRFAQLKIRPCLQAMTVLQHMAYFDQTTFDNLNNAYRFLRRLEHGIQAIDDQQTQNLPTDIDIQTNLAITLGFVDWQALIDTLNHHRDTVNVPFNRLVTDRHNSRRTINKSHIDISQLDTILNAENQKKLHDFWHSKLVKNLNTIALQRLKDTYPIMVEGLIRHEQNCIQHHKTDGANIALPRLLTLLEAICRRSIYLVMMAENPDASIDLIAMLYASPWIANKLTRYPVLLDSFLQQKYFDLPDKHSMRDIMSQRLLRVEPEDEEIFLNTIRLFKKNQLLAVAGSEVIASRTLIKVSNSLSYIAEVVLEATLQRAFADVVRSYGYPVNQENETVTDAHCGFAIIGYGKLGGIELSYSSDLDLVFLHSISETAMTSGDKSISGMRFAQRLAQKLMNYLTVQTRDGRAYEIDMRLRPSGSAGMMVTSVDAFEHYQRTQAWTWEHQALVRARAVCGDKAVMQRFAQVRHEILTIPRKIDELQADILAMRAKMRAHLGSDNRSKQQGNFHLKHDAGGIVDIEFMAQFGVLAYAHSNQNLTQYTDNIRIFELLAQTADYSEQQCQQLTQCYLDFRSTSHQLALAEKKLLVKDSVWHDHRAMVINYWNNLLGIEQNN